MKGAIAVPSVRTIREPKNKRKITMGASHHFFLSFKNSQNSNNIDILDILSPKS